MVVSARLLYDLQDTDLEIEARRQRIDEIDNSLGETEALIEARTQLAEVEAHQADTQRRQRALEWETDDLAHKLRPLEKKLYDGSIRNPKELTALQTDVEHLQRQKGTREDSILLLMEEGEATAAEIGRLRQLVIVRNDEWLALRDDLLQERARLEDELVELETARDDLRRQVDSPTLALYDGLRMVKQGRGVARVEQGRCQGCRIGLSSVEMQRGRLGRELVRCSSCGRILYIS